MTSKQLLKILQILSIILILEKNDMEILNMENTILEMKIIVNRINNRLDIVVILET